MDPSYSQFRRVERVLSIHIQKVERTECYPDFVSCCGRLKVNCIWKEKIICLTGESLLMEDLRYGAVAEQRCSFKQRCSAARSLGSTM